MMNFAEDMDRNKKCWLENQQNLLGVEIIPDALLNIY